MLEPTGLSVSHDFAYQVGGSIPIDNQSYIERQADRDLYDRLKAREYCFIFNSRQMGKSSLRVRTMQKLQQDGVKCVVIDPQTRGTTLREDQWYAGTVKRLIEDLNLSEHVSFSTWWKELDAQSISVVERFYEFVDQILLRYITEDVVVFVEEVDNLLSLTFDTDGFFSLIRSFHERRAENPAYQRLTFTFLGVATPYDLIRGHQYSAFNIGYAIELGGFQLSEAVPLSQGLIGKVPDPQAVLAAVLEWTGGQPFLTQKLLKLITREPESKLPADEFVRQVVLDKIVNQWESQDVPPHLKTLRDRLLLSDEKGRGRLLSLYQQVIENGSIPTDQSVDQRQLRLTGFVVKHNDQLFAYNPIYTKVFDKQWVKKCLVELRPSHYAEAIQAWFENNKQESYLLREKALGDVESWAKGKQLSAEDEEFLQECRVQDKWEADRKLKVAEEANQILIDARNKATRISIRVVLILFSILGIAAILGGQELNRLYLNGDIADANLDFSDHKGISSLLKIVRATQKFKSIPSFTLNYNETKSELLISLQRIVYGTWEANRLVGHKGRVNSVAFSPNGKIVASGSDDKTIKLWNKDGELLLTIPAHDDEITSVVFSPDGKIVASGSDDKTIKLWNLKGEQIQVFKKEPKIPEEDIGEKNSPSDGKLFPSPTELCKKASDDNAGHTGKVTSLAFSPDGKKLASTSCDTTVKLWGLDGKLLQTFKGHKDRVNSVVFANDQLLASGSLDNSVILWDLNGKIITQLQGTDVNSVAFSPDGKTLAGGNGDGKIHIWKILKNKIQSLKIFTGHSLAVRSLSFNKNGRILISSSKDKTINIWDLERGENTSDQIVSPLIKTIKGHSEEIKKVVFSADGKMIASASADWEVRLWNFDSGLDGGQQHKNNNRGIYQQVRFINNSQIISFNSLKKTVETWSLDYKLLNSFSIDSNRIVELGFSPDKKKIVFTDFNNGIKILNLQTKKMQIISNHDEKVVNLTVSPNAEMIASHSHDDIVKIWNWEGKLLQTVDRCKIQQVHRMAFSPDGKKLAMSGKDTTSLMIWDLDDHECKFMRKFYGHRQRIESLIFSPDGKTVATGSRDKTIKIWDLSKNENNLPKNLQGHQHWITSLVFSPDGKVLVSGSRDKSTKVWSSKDGSFIQELPGDSGFVNSVAFSPDGENVIASGNDFSLRKWGLNIDRSLKDGCGLLKPHLARSKDEEEKKIRSTCEKMI
jgi:WD40 repeat protein